MLKTRTVHFIQREREFYRQWSSGGNSLIAIAPIVVRDHNATRRARAWFEREIASKFPAYTIATIDNPSEESVMKPNQIEALRLLGEQTRGTFDPWDLTGPANAPVRARIMSALLDRRTPASKSGVTALRFHFSKLYAAPGGCRAERDSAFAAWAAAILRESGASAKARDS